MSTKLKILYRTIETRGEPLRHVFFDDLAKIIDIIKPVNIESEYPMICTKEAGIFHMTSIDINRAWIKSLLKVVMGEVPWVKVKRTDDRVVELLEKAIKAKEDGYAVIGCSNMPCMSQFMLFHCQKSEETEAEYREFNSLISAVLYCKSRCNCFVMKKKDITKYGVLTALGFVKRVRPDIFWSVVKLTNNVIREAVENARDVRIFSIHVDSIKAEDVIDVQVEYKVEYRDVETVHLLSNVYANAVTGAYWLIAMDDVSENWWFYRPWELSDSRLIEIYSMRRPLEHVMYPRAHRQIIDVEPHYYYGLKLAKLLKEKYKIIWTWKKVEDKKSGDWRCAKNLNPFQHSHKFLL